MRALAQGLDERTSWDRYLRVEGEHSDIRAVRRTIAWIRDEFAAAARREQRPGTARLVLLDTRAIAGGEPRPTLEEFAHSRGLADFAEAEQLEAYEAAYPEEGRAGGSGRRASRRLRVVERQLEAIRWLQGLVAADPTAGDPVSTWLHPALAGRLQRAGLATLAELVTHINAVGARWWVRVPGVGALKAARILAWLQDHESSLGLPIGAHVAQPRRRLTATMLAAVRPPGANLVPLEKLAVPAHLDGRAGIFRASSDACLLADVDTDLAAIGRWLAARGDGQDPLSVATTLTATQRSYRREAERLVLWAVLECHKPISSLTPDDILKFRRFLRDPPAAWCGPRHHQRWSIAWRPLEGPLNAAAERQNLIILRSLFTFLVAQRYVRRSPFDEVALPVVPAARGGMARTLTSEQWDCIDNWLCAAGNAEPDRRVRRAMRWLRATGLRVSDIAAATCGDLRSHQALAVGGRRATLWTIETRDRTGRRRETPVPLTLIDELRHELGLHGLALADGSARCRNVPILARCDPTTGTFATWSSSGVSQAIKRAMTSIAKAMPEPDAAQLRQAGTHWLRQPSGVVV